MKVIDRFEGQYAFLSNFYPSPVTLDRKPYRTVEHAYQAAKTDCTPIRALIQNTLTPGQAKFIGQYVRLREGWDIRIKFEVMRDLVRQKFTLYEELQEQLLETGDARLIEGNDWGDRSDRIWGQVNGQGQNHLGIILMEVRALIRETKKTLKA